MIYQMFANNAADLKISFPAHRCTMEIFVLSTCQGVLDAGFAEELFSALPSYDVLLEENYVL